jgi:cytochrome c-type biogenesis protein CcmH/NrfG
VRTPLQGRDVVTNRILLGFFCKIPVTKAVTKRAVGRDNAEREPGGERIGYYWLLIGYYGLLWVTAGYYELLPSYRWVCSGVTG